ncbi:MAG TPA: MerR family transcriptional regulator [Candidatus Dorea intestinavium]|nr:MerR family transcriptional regulator [Candidatus Dorea intestinavium]
MKHYFRIGEISKLYGIGPDSIRYYEELGILDPKRSENGYRMYSVQDLWRLNVIRDLRKLDFSMERIKEYLEHRSIASTEVILKEELEAITKELEELTRLRDQVKERLRVVQSVKSQTLDIIKQETRKERHCHTIHSGYVMDEEMDMLIEQLLNKDKENLYIIGNNRIGSTISLENVRQKKYRTYDSVFIMDSRGKERIPGGEYLTISYQGDGEKNDVYIPQLLTYAREHKLSPLGPVLELLLIDIHQSADVKEHITQLELLCKKKL